MTDTGQNLLESGKKSRSTSQFKLEWKLDVRKEKGKKGRKKKKLNWRRKEKVERKAVRDIGRDRDESKGIDKDKWQRQDQYKVISYSYRTNSTLAPNLESFSHSFRQRLHIHLNPKKIDIFQVSAAVRFTLHKM